MRTTQLLIAIAALLCFACMTAGCGGREEALEISGVTINFEKSLPKHSAKSKKLLARLHSNGEHHSLFDSVFLSNCEWIQCEVTRFEHLPSIELYSFHQNKIDPESFSKPPGECAAAQLIVDRATLNLVDIKINNGYSNVVPVLDGSWVVDWQLPSGELVSYQISKTGFSLFE